MSKREQEKEASAALAVLSGLGAIGTAKAKMYGTIAGANAYTRAIPGIPALYATKKRLLAGKMGNKLRALHKGKSSARNYLQESVEDLAIDPRMGLIDSVIDTHAKALHIARQKRVKADPSLKGTMGGKELARRKLKRSLKNKLIKSRSEGVLKNTIAGMSRDAAVDAHRKLLKEKRLDKKLGGIRGKDLRTSDYIDGLQELITGAQKQKMPDHKREQLEKAVEILKANLGSRSMTLGEARRSIRRKAKALKEQRHRSLDKERGLGEKVTKSNIMRGARKVIDFSALGDRKTSQEFYAGLLGEMPLDAKESLGFLGEASAKIGKGLTSSRLGTKASDATRAAVQKPAEILNREVKKRSGTINRIFGEKKAELYLPYYNEEMDMRKEAADALTKRLRRAKSIMKKRLAAANRGEAPGGPTDLNQIMKQEFGVDIQDRISEPEMRRKFLLFGEKKETKSSAQKRLAQMEDPKNQFIASRVKNEGARRSSTTAPGQSAEQVNLRAQRVREGLPDQRDTEPAWAKRDRKNTKAEIQAMQEEVGPKRTALQKKIKNEGLDTQSQARLDAVRKSPKEEASNRKALMLAGGGVLAAGGAGTALAMRNKKKQEGQEKAASWQYSLLDESRKASFVRYLNS